MAARDRAGRELKVGDAILISAEVTEIGAGDIRFVVEGQQPPDPMVLPSVYVHVAQPEERRDPNAEAGRSSRPVDSILADNLERLMQRYDAPWEAIKEPQAYRDGITDYNHVVFQSDRLGRADVMVATYVTPDLAELLCALHNNLPAIIAALRK